VLICALWPARSNPGMFAAVANWLRGMWPDIHFCSNIALIVIGVPPGQCLQNSAVRHVHQFSGLQCAVRPFYSINEIRVSLMMRTRVMLCCYLLLPLPFILPGFVVFFKREVKRGVSFNGPERSWACDSSLHTSEEPRSYFKEVGALLCGLCWWI
jgi:hypothetical protein